MDSTKVSMVILTTKNGEIRTSEKKKVEEWLKARLTIANELKVLFN
jgi:hypothetical protein